MPKPTNADVLRESLRAIAADRTKRDLSARQLLILLRLHQASPDTVRDLAEWCGVAKSAITRNIDRLVALGLAVRRPDPNDRRSVLLELTRAGRDFVGRVGVTTCNRRHGKI